MPNCDTGSWFLTIEFEGLPCRYHLRSASGSSGPIAKEKSPLLGWRPILILGASSIRGGESGVQSGPPASPFDIGVIVRHRHHPICFCGASDASLRLHAVQKLTRP